MYKNFQNHLNHLVEILAAKYIRKKIEQSLPIIPDDDWTSNPKDFHGYTI
jgi:hypothetical protein